MNPKSTALDAVGSVILAAGSSRRAGPVNKLLQDLHGRPLIWHAVAAVLDAALGPTWVVLGHDGAAVRGALNGLDVRFVHNERHEFGMGLSVAAGVRAASLAPVSGLLVVLGDMPWVRSADLRQLASAFLDADAQRVVVPVAGRGPMRRRGNPVVWPRRCFSELEALDGDRGGKAILERRTEPPLEVQVAHAGVLRDVDGALP